MKPGSVLLLTLLLFFLYSDIAAQGGFRIERYCKGYPKRVCQAPYRLHCGSDGRTYTNKCDFCNAYIYSGRTLRLLGFEKCRK